MRIVSIKWLDLVTYSDRMPISEAERQKPAVVYIFGSVIAETAQTITVTHQLCSIPTAPEAVVCDYSVIPKGNIVEIIEYKPVEAE